jgi:hypothetical protein
VWYFIIVPTVWYFRIVPTAWYFMFFILLPQQNRQHFCKPQSERFYNTTLSEQF